MHPVISLIHEDQPHPLFRQQFTDYQRVEMPLGDPCALLAMCSDGLMLAMRYTTTTDLLDLLRTKRLMPFVQQLRERSQWAYLLLDGHMQPNNSGKAVTNGNTSGWAWDAVQGALLSIQELGVQVVTLQSTRHLQDTVFQLAKRDRASRGVQPARDAFWYSAAENMLLALPGIGEERCAALLATYGSPAWALHALCDPESEIDGIGPATKAKIRHELKLSTTTRLAMVGLKPGLDADDTAYEELTHERNIAATDSTRLAA